MDILIRKIKRDVLRYSYGEKKNIYFLFCKAFMHLGFWALLNYRIGNFLRSKFNNSKIIWFITGITKMIIEILTGISIHYNCEIEDGMLIAHFSGIMIAGNVKIGKNITLHQNVTIGLAGRGKNKGVPFIGDDVFIGAGAVILGNISIGDNVAIGANTVVVKNIEDNAVVVGKSSEIISYKGSEGL